MLCSRCGTKVRLIVQHVILHVSSVQNCLATSPLTTRPPTANESCFLSAAVNIPAIQHSNQSVSLQSNLLISFHQNTSNICTSVFILYVKITRSSQPLLQPLECNYSINNVHTCVVFADSFLQSPQLKPLFIVNIKVYLF